MAMKRGKTVLLSLICTPAIIGPSAYAMDAPVDCAAKKLDGTARLICEDGSLRTSNENFSRHLDEKRKRLVGGGEKYSQSVGRIDSTVKKLGLDIDHCKSDTFCLSDAYARADAIVGGCYIQNNRCEKIPPSDPSHKVAKNEDFIKHNKDQLRASPLGIDLLKSFEAISLCLYNDSANYATIGIGHLIDYKPFSELRKAVPPTDWKRFKNGISDNKAMDIKQDDIKDRVTNFIFSKIETKLNQCQTDALISFLYNAGTGGKQNLYNLINNCEWAKVGSKMKEYIHAGGKISKGLINRRNQEGELWDKCVYSLTQPDRVKCCDYETIDGKERYRAKCGQGGII